MRRHSLLCALLVLGSFATACGGSSPPPSDGGLDAALPAHVSDLPAGDTLSLPGLEGAVEVVYDDRGIPHIYGTTLHDVFMTQGYVMSRDRFAQMEMIRRSVIGRLAEVLGAADSSLVGRDQDALQTGYRRWGEMIWAQLQTSTDPLDVRTREMTQAFVDGINVYIDRAIAGTENPAPDAANTFNIVLLSPAFGHWRPEDIMAMARYESVALSYEASDDVDRTLDLAAVRATFGGLTDPRRGLYADIFSAYPARPDTVRDGFPNEPTDTGMRALLPPGFGNQLPRVPMQLPERSQLAAASSFFERMNRESGLRPGGERWGSNNWIVSGSLTASGHPLLANDPHLALMSPPIWWYVHLDTALMHGEADLDVQGVAFAGLPGVVLGFNRHIAWGATVTGYDVTDVYIETITAGTGGAPDTVTFDPGTGPTQVAIQVSNEMLPRAGGAPVPFAIEIVPHHGVIIPGTRMPVSGMPGQFTALSVRYTGSDYSNELAYFAGLATAASVADAQAAQQHFEVGSQNFVVIDQHDIRWSTQSRVPLRDPRALTFAYGADGVATGYCPQFTLPGTGEYEWTGNLDSRYIPFDQNPTRGWVGTANGDATGTTLDGNPCNDSHYLGSADLGWRVHRVHEQLALLATRGNITTDDMMTLQATTRSSAGEVIRDPLVAILADAHTSVPSLTSAELARLDDVRMRLMAWSLETPHGVGATDATLIADSVATTIFNVSLTRIAPLALGDEVMAMGGRRPDTQRVLRFLEWGFGEPTRLVTGDALWDDMTTPTVTETREEIAIRGVLAALAYLDTRLGADENEWRWGRLHTVRFDAGQVGLPDGISIPPPDDAVYPEGFPRHGDSGAVDVGNYGLWNSTSFAHGSGASQRLVVEMTPTGPRAFNALPGGQALDPASAHHRDEAALWIENRAPAVAYEEADVIAHFERRLDVSP